MAANPPDTRRLKSGEKVYVSKIDVNTKNEKITFRIMECDVCNGVAEPSSYRAVVDFQFGKGYLETANVPDVEDTIGQVFAIDNSPATQSPQPGQASDQQAAPGAQAGDQQGGTQPPPASAVTNDDIIKMIQAKLGDSLIIAKIKSSPCAFDTSTDGLVKLKQAGTSDAVLQTMVEGGCQPIAAVPAQPAPTPPPAGTRSAPACSDYASCLASGSAAISASQWDRSLAELQKASSLEPTKPEAWLDMGSAYLAVGQYENAVAMWDKVLGLGGTLTFGVLYVQGLHLGKIGTFQLSAKEISLVGADKEKAFSVGSSEVSSVKSHRLIGLKVWSFSLKLGSRSYGLTFVPLGGRCMKAVNSCDPSGYSQEETVSNYVAQTMAKLAPGSVGK
jgi:hypothetical protein